MSPGLKPLWGLFAILVGATVVVSALRAFGPRDQVPWRTDFAAAKAEAVAAGKPLFAYFTADWCPPCQQMRRTTWADPRVAAALAARFVPVKIDIDRDPQTAIAYGIDPLPTYIVADAGGEPRDAASGYAPADAMLAWLDAAAKPTAPAAAATQASVGE
ncbi:MAG TPA: thioredoxin family protein [Tepidisphaeraceae bacterium]|nr:thioredoxin family protein [Tepidisphaeraceae bacterium]